MGMDCAEDPFNMGMFYNSRCHSKWVCFQIPNTHIRAFLYWSRPPGRWGAPVWGGGGGWTPVENAPMYVLGSENVPILNVASQKNVPIMKGSSARLIPLLRCNIKLKCIIHNGGYS